MGKKKVKWLQVSNSDDTATLKQHAYIHKVCKTPYIGEKYNGNVSLCGRSSVVNEEERRVALVDLDSELLNEEKACKLCLKKIKIYEFNIEQDTR